MNRSQNPWPETPAQSLVRLNTGMDRMGGHSKEARKHPNLLRKAVGGIAIAATALVGGTWFMNQAVKSVEVDTHLPSEAQKARVKVAIDKLGLPGSETTTTAATTDTKAVAAQREKYHIQPGDTAWDIVEHHLVDDNGQALAEKEIRPDVDAIQNQSGDNHILDPTDIVTLPEHTHYTAIDTHPKPQ